MYSCLFLMTVCVCFVQFVYKMMNFGTCLEAKHLLMNKIALQYFWLNWVPTFFLRMILILGMSIYVFLAFCRRQFIQVDWIYFFVTKWNIHKFAGACIAVKKFFALILCSYKMGVEYSGIFFWIDTVDVSFHSHCWVVFSADIMSYNVLLLLQWKKKSYCSYGKFEWKHITKIEAILHGFIIMSNVYTNDSRFDDNISPWIFSLFSHQFSYEKWFS